MFSKSMHPLLEFFFEKFTYSLAPKPIYDLIWYLYH